MSIEASASVLLNVLGSRRSKYAASVTFNLSRASLKSAAALTALRELATANTTLYSEITSRTNNPTRSSGPAVFLHLPFFYFLSLFLFFMYHIKVSYIAYLYLKFLHSSTYTFTLQYYSQPHPALSFVWPYKCHSFLSTHAILRYSTIHSK